MVNAASMRVTAPRFKKPERFDLIEEELKAARRDGDYAGAGKLQKRLEALKMAEDTKHQQMLAEKHVVELQSIEEKQKEEMKSFRLQWDMSMTSLSEQQDEQEKYMLERHTREHDEFKVQAQASVPKPKWSKSLLNTRRIEEHLIRQQCFAKAAKVKAQADSVEAEEVLWSEEQYWAKVSMDETKFLQRQSRELEALRIKAKALRDEASVAQSRDLDKLTKKFQASKIELSKSQGCERLSLDVALKGWYNPKRLAAPPSLLIPPSPLNISLMSPSLKVAQRRNEASSASPSPNSTLGGGKHSPFLSASRSPGSLQGSTSLPSTPALSSKSKPTGIMALPRALKPKSQSPSPRASYGSEENQS